MTGFPPGLSPPTWMTNLVATNPEKYSNWPLTRFRYPGSHDACTWGTGIAGFNWKCQNLDIYDQMSKAGHRFFDVRLALAKGRKFKPRHGVAKGTAEDFNQSTTLADENDIAAQIMRFANDQPGEVLILSMDIDLGSSSKWTTMLNRGESHATVISARRAIWPDTAWNLLGPRLLPPKGISGGVPTYQDVVVSNRNIILVMDSDRVMSGHPLASYFWEHKKWFVGIGDPRLYNDPDWKSGSVEQVRSSILGFMKASEDILKKREKFWIAQLQLTPALGDGISDFFSRGASYSPRDLALGRGICTATSGKERKGSNWDILQSEMFNIDYWQQNLSCVCYDFADPTFSGAIVNMNFYT